MRPCLLYSLMIYSSLTGMYVCPVNCGEWMIAIVFMFLCAMGKLDLQKFADPASSICRG